MKSNKLDSKNYDSERVIESGDIFFFYRPKIDTEEVHDIDDVQRFYMITCKDINVDDENKNRNKNYRLFMLGSKKMPEIVERKSGSEERNWALNILTSSNPIKYITNFSYQPNIQRKQEEKEDFRQHNPLEKENIQLLDMMVILN